MHNHSLISFFAASLILFLPILLCAQETAQDSLVAAPGFSFSGSFDAYYRYGFNESTTLTYPTLIHNSITPGWLSIGFSHEGKRAGLTAQVAFGPRASQFFGDADNVLTYVRLANVFVNVTDKFQVSGGIFPSFIGYEYDDPYDNAQYSNSYIYTITAAGFTGIQATYAFDEYWNVMAGLYNNAYTRLDFDNSKHIGAQLNFERNKFSCSFSYLYGKEPDLLIGHLFNLLGNVKIGSRLDIGFDLLMQKLKDLLGPPDLDWNAAALYASVQICDVFSANVRGEYVDDPKGYGLAVIDNKISSFTFAFNINIDHLKIIPEFRFDNAKRPTFQKLNSIPAKSEASFLLGVAYKFE